MAHGKSEYQMEIPYTVSISLRPTQFISAAKLILNFISYFICGVSYITTSFMVCQKGNGKKNENYLQGLGLDPCGDLIIDNAQFNCIVIPCDGNGIINTFTSQNYVKYYIVSPLHLY